MSSRNGFNHELEWISGAQSHRVLCQLPEDAKLLHDLLTTHDKRVEGARVVCVVIDTPAPKTVESLTDEQPIADYFAALCDIAGPLGLDWNVRHPEELVDQVIRLVNGLQLTAQQLRDERKDPPVPVPTDVVDNGKSVLGVES